MNKKEILTNLIKNLIIKKSSLINTNKPLISQQNIINNYNHKWDYNQIIYKQYNNNLLHSLKNNYLIKKYINYCLNHKLNNTKLSILYKEPIIIHNNNQYDILLFLYKPKNSFKTSDLLLNNIITNLIKTTDLNGLNLNIKPIILTYDYLDSEIYAQSLSKHLAKYPRLDTIRNIPLLNNIISKIVINQKNKLLLLQQIYSLMPHNHLINKNISIFSNLLHQFLIGNIWKYRGKNFNLESNARTQKHWNDNKLNTALSQSSAFKLNYYSANITQSNSHRISKNGKYNVRVTFNHF